MKLLRCWPLLFLLIAGCGDTLTDLLKEEAALANELADSLVIVYDEASAELVQKHTLKKLKAKLKALKERKDRLSKNTSIDRVLRLEFPGPDKVGQNGNFTAGDFTIKYDRPDKETLNLEITCLTASQVSDLRYLYHPKTSEHFESIRKRTDQQMLRIGYLLQRLKSAQPDGNFPALSTLTRARQEVFPSEFPKTPKVPLPYEAVLNAIRLKSSSS